MSRISLFHGPLVLRAGATFCGTQLLLAHTVHYTTVCRVRGGALVKRTEADFSLTSHVEGNLISLCHRNARESL